MLADVCWNSCNWQRGVTKALKMVEMNQENRVSPVNILDCIIHLTTGTLYRAQMFVNEHCLSHIKDQYNEKKMDIFSTLDTHKLHYTKRREDINKILVKNTKYKTELAKWRAMNMMNVCINEQKVLIGWLKRKRDGNIPKNNWAANESH